MVVILIWAYCLVHLIEGGNISLIQPKADLTSKK